MIVWLASYPRSGNTFFRVILNTVFDIKTYSIYNDVEDINADKKTSDVVGHVILPEAFDLKNARAEQKVYYIKTHELPDKRIDPSDKIIYLIRDGRESTLSFTKHQNTFADEQLTILDTIEGGTFVGNWAGHVKAWDPKHRDNTLLVQFEKLVKAPTSYIEQIAAFLEVEPTDGSIPTFEELKAMNPKFFRSGKTNSWEKVYTDEEHAAFWDKSCEQMLEYGYTYKIPNQHKHGSENPIATFLKKMMGKL